VDPLQSLANEILGENVTCNESCSITVPKLEQVFNPAPPRWSQVSGTEASIYAYAIAGDDRANSTNFGVRCVPVGQGCPTVQKRDLNKRADAVPPVFVLDRAMKIGEFKDCWLIATDIVTKGRTCSEYPMRATGVLNFRSGIRSGGLSKTEIISSWTYDAALDAYNETIVFHSGNTTLPMARCRTWEKPCDLVYPPGIVVSVAASKGSASIPRPIGSFVCSATMTTRYSYDTYSMTVSLQPEIPIDVRPGVSDANGTMWYPTWSEGTAANPQETYQVVCYASDLQIPSCGSTNVNVSFPAITRGFGIASLNTSVMNGAHNCLIVSRNSVAVRCSTSFLVTPSIPSALLAPTFTYSPLFTRRISDTYVILYGPTLGQDDNPFAHLWVECNSTSHAVTQPILRPEPDLVTVNGLLPATRYSCNFMANNSVGTVRGTPGDFSTLANLATKPLAANLSLVGGPSFINARWVGSGPDYVSESYALKCDGLSDVTTDLSSATIQNLTPGMNVSCVVVTTSVNGEAKSNRASVLLGSAAGAVEDLTGSVHFSSGLSISANWSVGAIGFPEEVYILKCVQKSNGCNGMAVASVTMSRLVRTMSVDVPIGDYDCFLIVENSISSVCTQVPVETRRRAGIPTEVSLVDGVMTWKDGAEAIPRESYRVNCVPEGDECLGDGVNVPRGTQKMDGLVGSCALIVESVGYGNVTVVECVKPTPVLPRITGVSFGEFTTFQLDKPAAKRTMAFCTMNSTQCLEGMIAFSKIAPGSTTVQMTVPRGQEIFCMTVNLDAGICSSAYPVTTQSGSAPLVSLLVSTPTQDLRWAATVKYSRVQPGDRVFAMCLPVGQQCEQKTLPSHEVLLFAPSLFGSPRNGSVGLAYTPPLPTGRYTCYTVVQNTYDFVCSAGKNIVVSTGFQAKRLVYGPWLTVSAVKEVLVTPEMTLQTIVDVIQWELFWTENSIAQAQWSFLDDAYFEVRSAEYPAAMWTKTVGEVGISGEVVLKNRFWTQSGSVDCEGADIDSIFCTTKPNG
jgi:hypothetical protein